MEIWKDIEGFSGYQASNLGNIRSVRRRDPQILKTRFYGQYLIVTLMVDGKHQMRSVHRLVAKAFIPNPENKPFVNHINAVKTDNRVENLEWCTFRENTDHAMQLGLNPSGERCGTSKLSNEQAEYIRTIYVPYNKEFGVGALARKFGVNKKTIHSIIRGRSYKSANGKVHDSAAKRIPDEIRAEIRNFYQKGVPGRGLPSIVKKFGVSLKTAHNIVRECRPPTASFPADNLH